MSEKVRKHMLEEGNCQEKPISAKDYFRRKGPIQLAVNNSHLLSVRRSALPIIFVPGIMASRLYNPEMKVPAWDPDAPIALAWQYLGLSPERRFELLAKDKEKLQVMNQDIKDVTEHCQETFGSYPHAVDRGWGGIMWNAYGALIEALDTWATPLKFLVDLPVYAFGYNWMLSNKENGKNLAAHIGKVKEHHGASHVILITHSMGGVVARAACGIYEAESDVFAVIHGAQPSLGAVDAYRRMVAGETGSGVEGAIMASVIGAKGKHITALLGNTIGGLELLPTKHYHLDPAPTADKAEKKQWLHMLVEHKGELPKLVLSKPDSKEQPECFGPGREESVEGSEQLEYDPYTSIYLEKKAYWRLLHEEWIIATGDDPVEQIRGNVERAREFHEELEKETPYAHPRTVQLYSSEKLDTFCEIVWLTEEVTSEMQNLCDEVNTSEFAEWHDEYIKTRHRVGTYKEYLFVSKREEIDEAKEYEGVLLPYAFDKGGFVFEHLAKGGLIYARSLLDRGDSVAGYPASHKGDSTVPEQSGQGLAPSAVLWPQECRQYFVSMSSGKKQATFRPNSTTHQDFYDEDAIKATKNAINNIVLAWVDEHCDKPGKEIGCTMECIRNFSTILNQKNGQGNPTRDPNRRPSQLPQ